MVGERDTVIHLAVGCGGESYLTLGDGQRAVLDDKLNIGEVIADVLKVFGNKLHVIAAGIGAGDSGIAGEAEVISGVERIADLGVVAGDGLFAAVILCSAAVLGDGDDHFSGNGGYLQLAGGKGDVVVVGIKLIGSGVHDGVVNTADLGDGSGGLDLGDFAVNEAAGGELVVGIGERLAVVDPAAALGLDDDYARGDGQGAVNGVGEFVVAGDIIAAAHDLVGLDNVCAAALVGLAALNDCLKHVAINEDALGEGAAIVGERLTVVLSGLAVRGDGDYV